MRLLKDKDHESPKSALIEGLIKSIILLGESATLCAEVLLDPESFEAEEMTDFTCSAAKEFVNSDTRPPNDERFAILCRNHII